MINDTADNLAVILIYNLLTINLLTINLLTIKEKVSQSLF